MIRQKYAAMALLLVVTACLHSQVCAQVVYYEATGDFSINSEPVRQFTALFGIDPNAENQLDDIPGGEFLLTSASLTIDDGTFFNSGILNQFNGGGTLSQNIDFGGFPDDLDFRFAFEQDAADHTIARQLDLERFRFARVFRLSDFRRDDDVNVSFRVVSVPEPSCVALICPFAIAYVSRRRRKRALQFCH